MKIYHASDTHCHHDDENNVELQKRIVGLAAIVKPEDVVVFTGDLTDDGRPDQREKIRALLKQLICTVLILPGNHDFGAIGSFFDKQDAKGFDELAEDFLEAPFYGKIPVLKRIENVLLILLNSNLKTDQVTDFACGKIGVIQLGLLDRLLKDPGNEGLVKVVCLHHHPFMHSDLTMRLVDSDLFMETIAGRVDVLLFGHRHIEGYWHDKHGCREISAADALFEATHIKQFEIEGNEIYVKKIQLIGKGDV